MRVLIILLTVLISLNLLAQKNRNELGNMREKPRIMVVCSNPKNDKFDNTSMADMQRRAFAQEIANLIKTEFPCANVFTHADIEMKIENDRRVWELNEYAHFDNVSEKSFLTEIGGTMNCDIIVSLSSYRLGDNTYLFGRCMSTKSATVFSSNETHGSETSNSELAREIIRDLAEREICPYKGEITYSSVTTFKESQERNGLPGQDCEFKATKEEDKKTEENWTFQKTNRIKGTSTVDYSINNYKKETEHNTCNHCKKTENGVQLDVFEPNRADMLTSTETNETYLANKTAPIEYQDERYSALIRIEFNTRANNYSIIVKAATQPAKWHMKTVTTNSGCPYDENYENELGAIIPKPFERTFGPFPGSPFQKNLKQNDTKTIIDPDSKGKGKTVQTFSFNLSR